MNIRKLMITGLPASGKTTLMKLLDGHPNIKAVHTHDKILSAFYSFDKGVIISKSKKYSEIIDSYSEKKMPKLKINDNKIIDFNPFLHRYLLNNYTSYYITETWSSLGVLPSEATSLSYQNELFQFDFLKYDKNIYNKIFNSDRVISMEEYFDIFYESYFTTWAQYPKTNDDAYYVYFGPNDISASKYVLEQNFNIKIIYFDRKPEGQIISRATRSYRNNSINRPNKEVDDYILNYIINSSALDKYRSTLKTLEHLIAEYSDKIYRIEFEKLIECPEKEMKKLSNWLGIEYQNTLLTPSLAGSPVSPKYLEKINDEYQDIRSETLQLLNLKIYGLKFFLSGNETITLKIIMLYFKTIFIRLLYKK